jgi:chorismate mutase
MTQDCASIESLRREIDRIDDTIHDLLLERAGLVGRISAAKPEGITALRPGREAGIVRRLLARHQGPFPRLAVVRIWREIIGALLAMQEPFSVAVHATGRGGSFVELARNHFGVVVPLQICRSSGQVVRAVADGHASAGLVPLPQGEADADDPEPWWASLAAGSGGGPKVVARLPFAGVGAIKSGSEPPQALLIACRDHDETGDDHTLAVLETAPDVSRDRLRAAMAAGGLESLGLMGLCRHGDQWLHLVEIAGYVAATDPRLARITQTRDPISHFTVIGGYATPLPLDAVT